MSLLFQGWSTRFGVNKRRASQRQVKINIELVSGSISPLDSYRWFFCLALISLKALSNRWSLRWTTLKCPPRLSIARQETSFDQCHKLILKSAAGEPLEAALDCSSSSDLGRPARFVCHSPTAYAFLRPIIHIVVAVVVR